MGDQENSEVLMAEWNAAFDLAWTAANAARGEG